MQVRIDRVSNGFIVTAGCLTLVYTSTTAIIADFEKWVTDPDMTEKAFAEKYSRGHVDAPLGSYGGGAMESAEIGKSPYPFESGLGSLKTRQPR